MTLRILIAEDYKDLAESYKTILEGRGHEVTITSDGIECLRAYKQKSKQPDGKVIRYFDVIILDYQMKGMNGIDAAKEIQKIDPNQKIIFVTGYGSEVIQKLKELIRNAGVMNKPFTLDALLAEVEGRFVSRLQAKTSNVLKDWDEYTTNSVQVSSSRIK
ncbi:MAG: response regulator [Thaumarchaeota archaeon]|nr:response regulator [Nitrososphaerota archaeon]